MNLFIAIVIDAFLGQTFHFDLPIKKYSLTEYVNIWSKYDPKATGFIDIDKLKAFIVELAKSSDGHELIIWHEKVLTNFTHRRRFVALLSIPTYDQFKKVMFYDVLQQLCDKKNLLKHSEELKEQVEKSKILRRFDTSHIQDDLNTLMNASENTDA